MVPVGGQAMLGVKAGKTLLGMSGVASASKQLLQAGKIAVNVGTIPVVAAKGIADITNNNQYNKPLNNLNTDFSAIDKVLEFAINPSVKTAISIGLDYSKNVAINTFNVVETLNNAVHLPIRTKEDNHKNTVNTIEQAVILPDFGSGYPVCKPKDKVICK